jgi:Leucine-rich repeat (LRR) protein
MQLAIAAAVPFAADVVQALERPSEAVEILQPGDVTSRDFLAFAAGHACLVPSWQKPTSWPSAGAKCVPNSIGTSQLFVARTKITDRDLESICRLRKIEILDLNATHIEDVALASIAILKNLTELRIADTLISSRGAQNAGVLRQLKRLQVHGPSFAEPELQSLRSNLTALDISGQ